MSGLVRLSSSSDTVRVDMYQKIQINRLKKMSREPVKMKKSQKDKEAKIPTRKRISPTRSRITASATKRLVVCFCSMLAGLTVEPPTFLLAGSDALRFIHSCLEPRRGNRAFPHSFPRTDSFDSFRDTSSTEILQPLLFYVKRQLLPPRDAKFRF